MPKAPYEIVVFLVVVTLLIVILVTFIIGLLIIYKKNQDKFFKDAQNLRLNFERNLLSAQLEIQEETFLSISREIHDNISLSLTLAKLHMNTLDLADRQKAENGVKKSVDLLSDSIIQLSEISKSLNAELIIEEGLLKALEYETKKIRDANLFDLKYIVEGNPVYLEAQRELIIFRIIQEAFNNIIKHSGAGLAELKLNYNAVNLYIDIADNGKGFNSETSNEMKRAGLKNMNSRTTVLQGTMKITSVPGRGTILSFVIPYN
jgi:two-component system NarL family sensor kinase